MSPSFCIQQLSGEKPQVSHHKWATTSQGHKASKSPLKKLPGSWSDGLLLNKKPSRFLCLSLSPPPTDDAVDDAKKVA